MRPTLLTVLTAVAVAASTGTVSAAPLLKSSGPIDRPIAWGLEICPTAAVRFVANGSYATLVFTAKNRRVSDGGWMHQSIDNVTVIDAELYDAHQIFLTVCAACVGNTTNFDTAPWLVFADRFAAAPNPGWDMTLAYFDPSKSAPSTLGDGHYCDQFPGGCLGLGASSDPSPYVTTRIRIDGMFPGREYVVNFFWVATWDTNEPEEDLRLDIFGSDLVGHAQPMTSTNSTWRATNQPPPAGWNTDPGFQTGSWMVPSSAGMSPYPPSETIWAGQLGCVPGPHEAFLRATFDIGTMPFRAILRGGVDDDCELWLNGTFVPQVSSSDCLAQSFPETDVVSLLHLGTNLIAVHATDCDPFCRGVCLQIDAMPAPGACNDLIGNGFVGLYADPSATSACAPEGNGYLYLIARLQGNAAAGVDYATLRLEVSDPKAYAFQFYPDPGVSVFGDPMDLEPNDRNTSGALFAFDTCRTPTGTSSQVDLGILEYQAILGGPCTIRIKGIDQPIPGIDAPVFETCAGQLLPMTHTQQALGREPIAFRTGIADPECPYCPTTDVEAPPRASQLIVQPNVPDPFNPTTLVRYELPAAGWVRVDVLDVRGRIARSLFHGDQEAGAHSLRWDGRLSSGHRASSGVYWARIETSRNTARERMTLLK